MDDLEDRIFEAFESAPDMMGGLLRVHALGVSEGARTVLLEAAKIVETEPSTEDDKGIARWLRDHARRISEG